MSAIPKARRSNVVDLTVTPAEWDAHPEVSRSDITSCTFKDLNSSTNISRSKVSHSTIEPSSTKKKSQIDRSKVYNSHIFSSHVLRSKLSLSTVTDSWMERTRLDNCNLESVNQIERTAAQATKFVSAKRVERSWLKDSVIMGDSTADRCIMQSSVISDKTGCERSRLDSSVITRSQIERSNITDCDVMDCKIKRTDFKGMTLKYGIWKNGDLIGRTSNEHEVVIEPRRKPLPTTESSSPLPTPPVQTSESGWKAAEAERELVGIEEEGYDYDDDNEDLVSELEASTDDERSLEHAKQSKAPCRSMPATFIADTSDPPPPYEQ